LSVACKSKKSENQKKALSHFKKFEVGCEIVTKTFGLTIFIDQRFLNTINGKSVHGRPIITSNRLKSTLTCRLDL